LAQKNHIHRVVGWHPAVCIDDQRFKMDLIDKLMVGAVTANLAGKSARALGRAAVTTIILALAVLPAATPVFAKDDRTVLVGTDHRFFDGPPARVWTAGPLTQIRGQKFTGTFTWSGKGITLAGSETQLIDATLDFATGNGFMWGVTSYTDTATGVTCSGRISGKITTFLATGTIVTRCSNGARVWGSVQDTAANPVVENSSVFHLVLRNDD
jgi:hypothetical protein